MLFAELRRRVVNRIWLYNPPGFLVKAGKCFMTLWATDSIPFNSSPSHRTSTQLTIMQEELRAETKVPVAVPVLVLTNILNILNPCSTSFTMPKKLPQMARAKVETNGKGENALTLQKACFVPPFLAVSVPEVLPL